MLFRECPDCQHRFTWEDWVCPECGSRVETYYQRGAGTSSTGVLFTLAMFGALLFLVFLVLCFIVDPGMSDPAPFVSAGASTLFCIGFAIALGIQTWQTTEHKWQWMVYANQHDLRKWERAANE